MNIHRLLPALLLGSLLAPAAPAAVEYEVVNLGTLGGTRSVALGLNDRSEAVGWSLDSSNRMQAFVWRNGTLTGLGNLPGGTGSVATAINNAGAIVGYAATNASRSNAFLYSAGTMQSLGTLGGRQSEAWAINENADITGLSDLPLGGAIYFEPFLWRTNFMAGIVPFSEKETATGFGINAAGLIVGYTILDIPDSNRTWGFIWIDANSNSVHDPGEMKPLGTLGGQYSEAYAINRSGQVVGWASTNNSSIVPYHAYLITPENGVWKKPTYSNTDRTNTLMRDLGALGSPANNSVANALNDRTWVVGFSTTNATSSRAFLWRNDVMVDLNDLIPTNSGWVLTNATGINYHNEIVGSGLYQGQTRAFMLRREGRITGIESVVQTNTWVYTNELSEVVTQTSEHVETQILHWGGMWGTNAQASWNFTLEYCDALQNHVWTPVDPTSQWPAAVAQWTNPAFATPTKRFYRVVARESAGD